MTVTLGDISTETLTQDVVTVVLPPSLFMQITQEESDTNNRTNAETTGVIFTFYESSVLFPVANGTNSSGDDTLIIVGTPVIGADIAGLDVIELAESFITILLQLNNEVN